MSRKPNILAAARKARDDHRRKSLITNAPADDDTLDQESLRELYGDETKEVSE